MATCSSILARESHGQGSLVCYCPWGPKESECHGVSWLLELHGLIRSKEFGKVKPGIMLSL